MRQFKSHIRRATLGVISAMSLLVACQSDPEDGIGGGFTPDGQQMEICLSELRGVNSAGESVLSTRLFQSRRINAANQGTLSMGVQYSDKYGERRSGFFSQYTPYFQLDESGFGYKPLLDSVMLYLSLSNYDGDTTQSIKYNVYEVLDDDFLANSADTVFQNNFRHDPEVGMTLSTKPSFTFTYPDYDKGIYLSAKQVRMHATEDGTGLDLFKKMMLEEVDGEKLSYEIYNDNYELFVKTFKGLYIEPAEDNTFTTGGATYVLNAEGSGFGFYGRSLYEEDPSFVADTIGMTFSFYDSYANYKSVSINAIDYDYTQGEIGSEEVKDSEKMDEAVATTSTVRVSGMGGVVTEVSFEKPLFQMLLDSLDVANEKLKETNLKPFTNIYINSSQMSIYAKAGQYIDDFGGSSVDPSYDFETLLEELKWMPSRLGAYTKYSTFRNDKNAAELTAPIDYNFFYELNYGVESDFGGYFSRSKMCYTMSLPLFTQIMWSKFKDEYNSAGDDIDAIDFDAADWNKLYIAPTADALFTPRYVELQGMADGLNGAPIKLNLTYTLLKE